MASGFTTPEGKVYGVDEAAKAAKAACEAQGQYGKSQDYTGKAAGDKSKKAPAAKSGRAGYGK